MEIVLAITLAILAVIAYLTYFHDAHINGSYVLNLSVAGASFSKVVIELPTENGTPIYRLRSFSATITHEGVSENITPVFGSIVDGYPTVIEIPYNFSNGDYVVTGDFTIEPSSPWTNYGDSPWTLEIGGQIYLIDPSVRVSPGFKLVLLAKEYSYILIPALTALATGIAASYLIILKRS